MFFFIFYEQITADEVKDNRAVVMEVEAKNLDKKVDMISLCVLASCCNHFIIRTISIIVTANLPNKNNCHIQYKSSYVLFCSMVNARY